MEAAGVGAPPVVVHEGREQKEGWWHHGVWGFTGCFRQEHLVRHRRAVTPAAQCPSRCRHSQAVANVIVVNRRSMARTRPLTGYASSSPAAVRVLQC